MTRRSPPAGVGEAGVGKPGGELRAEEAEAARGCAGAAEGDEVDGATRGCAAMKGAARGSAGASKGDEEDGTSAGSAG